MLELFMIMAVLTYCIERSGFVEPLRSLIGMAHERWDKPLFCARCLTFWAGVALSCIHGDIIYIVWGSLWSWLSPTFHVLLLIIEDLFIYLYNRVALLEIKLNDYGKRKSAHSNSKRGDGSNSHHI